MIRDRLVDPTEYSTRSCDSSRLSTFLVGAVAGAAAGAVVALLFAPASGRRSRAWLKDGALRLREGAEDQFDRAQDAIDDGASKLRGAVESGKGVLRESVAAAREGYARSKEEHEALTAAAGNRKT